jgi:hypothetical protein
MGAPLDEKHWQEIEQYWRSYLDAFDRHLAARTIESAGQTRREMRAELELRMTIAPPGEPL